MEDPIIAILEEEWASIAALGRDLSEAEWKTPIALEGWTVQDCVAHVIGVEASMIGDPMPEADVSHLSYITDPFQEIVEIPIEARRKLSGAEVLAEYEAFIPRRLAHLRAMSAEEMAKPGWSPIGEVPYRDFLVVRVFDCWMHEQDMRRALDRPGHMTGPVVDTMLDRFRAAIPYVVGRKARAPEGSTTVWRISGDVPLVWTTSVIEGRAKLVGETEADVPGEPTVTLSMPFASFVALGGGRWTVSEARAVGPVTVEGDTDLGERILSELAFTP